MPQHTEVTPAGRPEKTSRDPAQLVPDIYRVALENDRVRVLEIRLPPNKTSPMHSHPDYIAFAISKCHVRFTGPDGTQEELRLEPGQCAFRSAETHSVENLASNEVHALNIELRRP